jgi:hypothetical protein
MVLCKVPRGTGVFLTGTITAGGDLADTTRVFSYNRSVWTGQTCTRTHNVPWGALHVSLMHSPLECRTCPRAYIFPCILIHLCKYYTGRVTVSAHVHIHRQTHVACMAISASGSLLGPSYSFIRAGLPSSRQLLPAKYSYSYILMDFCTGLPSSRRQLQAILLLKARHASPQRAQISAHPLTHRFESRYSPCFLFRIHVQLSTSVHMLACKRLLSAGSCLC